MAEPTVIERMVMAYHKAESAGVSDETEAMLAAVRELRECIPMLSGDEVMQACGNMLMGYVIDTHEATKAKEERRDWGLSKSDTGSKG